MTGSEPAGGPPHVPVLDGLRGVAILLVVLFHCAVIAPDTRADAVYLFLASAGFTGVDLFFVLSGYLITGILLDARSDALSPPSPTEPRASASGPEGEASPAFATGNHALKVRLLTRAVRFYARRALRTLPLYYAVLALALFVLPRFLPAEKVESFGRIRGDAVYYWLHLSNVAIARAQAFRHPVLDVSWSLAIEEQFYLVWPLVVLACSRRALVRVALGAVAGALALRVVMAVVLHRDPHETYVLTPCRMDTLAVGALVAILARAPGGLCAWRRRAVGAAVIAAPIALVTILADFPANGAIVLPGSAWPLATVGFSAVAVTFGAVLVLVLTGPSEGALARGLRSGVLGTFGKYSYAIYLVHLPVRAVIRDRVFGPGWSGARWKFPVVLGSELGGQVAFDVVCAGAALGLAWVSYHAFEARFLALKRRFPMQ